MNKKDFWIGIGIGATVGLTTGFIVGNQVTKRAARRDIKKIRHQAYIKGQEDMKAEYEANVIFVDSTDPKVIQQAVDDFNRQNGSSSEKDEKTEETDEEEDKSAQNDDAYAEKEPQPRNYIGFSISGDNAIFIGAAGTEIRYPKYLIVNKSGDLLSDLEIRENFKSFEPDVQKLRVVWNAMGWGTYIPDLDGRPNAWDQNLNIDDDGDSVFDTEPEEKTIERQRYLDEIDRYMANPEEAPRIISREDFDDECYLEKLYFDYYDVDNKFVENTDFDKEVDAVTLFGVSDGNELFKNRTHGEEDPDIVHVKNFRMNCVAEITRFHRAYQSIKDGSAYVNGVTN